MKNDICTNGPFIYSVGRQQRMYRTTDNKEREQRISISLDAPLSGGGDGDDGGGDNKRKDNSENMLEGGEA